MEFLNDWLPIIIYILLIILISLLIVLVVKLIKTMKKVDGIVDNVDKKVRALDGVFELIDTTTNTLATFGEKVIGAITGLFEKIFSSKTKKTKIEEDE